jgi:hypothetical protein
MRDREEVDFALANITQTFTSYGLERTERAIGGYDEIAPGDGNEVVCELAAYEIHTID